MKIARILLVDDHTLVRAGVRSLINGISGLEVVGEASDGREALASVKARSPDVVLMDVAMRGMNGLDATAAIKAQFPEVKVIVLSMNATEEHVLRALRLGASGYLLKDADPGELERAIHAVLEGDTYLSPVVSTHISEYVRRVGAEAGPLERLTARQREVLQLIAEGKSTKEIAKQLEISVKTADTHRTQLMRQLDIHDVAGLVRFAIREGLVSPDA